MNTPAQDLLGPHPGAAAPAAVKTRGFGLRALAYGLDLVVVGVIDLVAALVSCLAVTFAVGLALLALGGKLSYSDQDYQAPHVLLAAAMLFAYGLLFEGFYGATPGKALLRMRVVKDDGRPCTFKAALVRGLARFLDGLFFGAIAYGRMRRPPHQRLGDLWAETLVVAWRDPFVRNAPPAWRFWAAAGAYFLLSAAVNAVLWVACLTVR